MSNPNYYIIGASGLIGSALHKKFSINDNVIGTYKDNFNSNLIKFDLEKFQINNFLNSIDGNCVFYLMSAYSNPNWIFLNKNKAFSLNYKSTIKLINHINKFNGHIIFMSSVEVFDGTEGRYNEKHKPNPLNYYGKLKFDIEKYLKQNVESYTIVRTGWNIGYNSNERCVIRLTYDTILKKNAMMAHDNYFSVIDVEDTSAILFLIGKKLKNKPKIINICSDEIINRYELAKFIKQNSRAGKKMDFQKCMFKDIKYTEPRGRINDLDNSFSKKLFNFNYKNAYDVILKKIKFIDDLYGF